ncbi:ribbon-helix-helix protein, CopG family [Sphingobium fontiphilum]|uniref:ribbon-helix-helix protein, CopG family n=1 Tax=Sphingobium fontiphilum TaxID=944425 RepID=UPI0031B568AE
MGIPARSEGFKEKMSNFPLRLDVQVMEAVKRLSRREGLSANRMIEVLLREALKQRRVRIFRAAQGE